jgi:hypothetical protein
MNDKLRKLYGVGLHMNEGYFVFWEQNGIGYGPRVEHSTGVPNAVNAADAIAKAKFGLGDKHIKLYRCNKFKAKKMYRSK